MRRSALYVIPVLLLALNGCGGGGGGGAGGKGGTSAKGGTSGGGKGGGAGGKGGSGGTAGTTGGSTGGSAGGAGGSSGGSGGATGGSGGSGGATGGSSGGATGGSGGATGGSAGGAGGATGGSSGGATGGSSGGANGGSGGSGVGGSAGLTGLGGVGGLGGTTGVGGTGGVALCGNNSDPDEGLTCNTLLPTGPCATVTIGTGSPPAATGGQWVAGTYDLTARTVYNAPDGNDPTVDTRRETVVVTGSGTSFTVQMVQMSGTQMRRQSGTVTTSSATHQFTFTPTCPGPDDGGDSGGTLDYSVDGSTFTIYDMGGDGTIRVDVYTRRST